MRQSHVIPRRTPELARLALHPHEWRALLQLDDWAFRLFLALVACSDFRTGDGRASYVELIGLMTPAQPERGPRLHVRSRDEVKNMLLRFAELDLMERNTVASEAAKVVIFHVAPRTSKAASDWIATRELTRHENGTKRATARAAGRSTVETDPKTDPPFHEGNSKTARVRPPVEKSQGPRAVRDALEAVKKGLSARRGVPQSRPPKGG